MTCILTDEEIEEAIRSSDGTLKSCDKAIANAAARKALAMAARECDMRATEHRDSYHYSRDAMAKAADVCADAIRELAGRFE